MVTPGTSCRRKIEPTGTWLTAQADRTIGIAGDAEFYQLDFRPIHEANTRRTLCYALQHGPTSVAGGIRPPPVPSGTERTQAQAGDAQSVPRRGPTARRMRRAGWRGIDCHGRARCRRWLRRGSCCGGGGEGGRWEGGKQAI